MRISVILQYGMAQFEFELVAFAVDDTQIPQIHGGVARTESAGMKRVFIYVLETADSIFLP